METDTPGQDRVFCPSCSAVAENGDVFCAYCGTDLGAEESLPVATSDRPQQKDSAPSPPPNVPSVDQSTAFKTCPRCAEEVRAAAQLCRFCGHQFDSRNAPSAPTPTGVPPELLAVVGLLCLAGGLILLAVLTSIPDTLTSLGGDFGAFGFLALVFLLIAGFIGVSCLALAKKVYEGDRVARILAVVLGVGISIAYLGANYRTTSDTVTALISAAASAIIVFSPGSRSHFNRETSADADQPSSVVAARALITVLVWIFALVGLALLPLSEFDGKLGLIGIGMLAASIVVYNMAGSLGTGAAQSRINVSIVMGVYILLSIVSGSPASQLLWPISLGAAVISLLWFTEESNKFFGQTI